MIMLMIILVCVEISLDHNNITHSVVAVSLWYFSQIQQRFRILFPILWSDRKGDGTLMMLCRFHSISILDLEVCRMCRLVVLTEIQQRCSKILFPILWSDRKGDGALMMLRI
jgi:hypothetical protein